MVIYYILPCAASILLIAEYGLMGVWAVLLLEIILMLITNRGTFGIEFKCNDFISILLTSGGIIWGAKQYVIQSSPLALGVAVTMLIIIVHAALFLIFSGLMGRYGRHQ